MGHFFHSSLVGNHTVLAMIWREGKTSFCCCGSGPWDSPWRTSPRAKGSLGASRGGKSASRSEALCSTGYVLAAESVWFSLCWTGAGTGALVPLAKVSVGAWCGWNVKGISHWLCTFLEAEGSVGQGGMLASLVHSWGKSVFVLNRKPCSLPKQLLSESFWDFFFFFFFSLHRFCQSLQRPSCYQKHKFAPQSGVTELSSLLELVSKRFLLSRSHSLGRESRCTFAGLSEEGSFVFLYISSALVWGTHNFLSLFIFSFAHFTWHDRDIRIIKITGLSFVFLFFMKSANC